MQNIIRSRLTPSLLGIAAVKVANEYSENKVWGAAPMNCAQHPIKFVDLAKGQGAIIDANGSLIQFTMPMVSMSPPYTQVEQEQVQEYTTILKGKLVDVACSFDQVFSLSRNGTVFKTPKGQKDTINSSIYQWMWPQYTVQCDGLVWGEKIVQLDAGDHFVIARSNKGYDFIL
jgi:alpha-tubulin suppressor-like RCC1 family protein